MDYTEEDVNSVLNKRLFESRSKWMTTYSYAKKQMILDDFVDNIHMTEHPVSMFNVDKI